ncbi:Protein kinase domain-containing protein [Aphelenchoides fujianensis]|nr:Protein kinase domain-containing protein [Aphelenchoides fujianensis]
MATPLKSTTKDENEKDATEDEFQTENQQAKRLADFISAKGVIGKYRVKKVIGAGANGLVALVNHVDSGEQAVMKVAMNLSTSGSLYWESDVMDRLLRAGDEDRTRHLVRKLDSGHTRNPKNEDVGFVVMENLPGNPVGVLGFLSGRALIQKTCEFGLQLLKYPLAWAPFDAQPHVRHLMKTPLFPAKLVLRNCPPEFFKIQLYLRQLGRAATPNYFFLATTLQECIKRLAEEQRLEEAKQPKPKVRRARFPTFFEVEQMLDEYEEYHADTTVAGKMDLKRVGIETKPAVTPK